jgi:hypothetical protein
MTIFIRHAASSPRPLRNTPAEFGLHYIQDIPAGHETVFGAGRKLETAGALFRANTIWRVRARRRECALREMRL